MDKMNGRFLDSRIFDVSELWTHVETCFKLKVKKMKSGINTFFNECGLYTKYAYALLCHKMHACTCLTFSFSCTAYKIILPPRVSSSTSKPERTVQLIDSLLTIYFSRMSSVTPA